MIAYQFVETGKTSDSYIQILLTTFQIMILNICQAESSFGKYLQVSTMKMQKIIINNERKRKYEKEISEKTKEIIINNDVLNLIQGSLYYSKKKGRALYNINPKDYGKSSQKEKKVV